MTVSDELRARLRVLDPREEVAWLQLCDAAVSAAQRAGDGAAVAEVSLLAAIRLDARGRTTEALARYDFGQGFVAPGSDTWRHLQCARALTLAVIGDLVGARRAFDAAGVVGERSSERGRFEHAVYAGILECIAVERVDVRELQSLLLQVQAHGFDWLASGLVSWVIPRLVASGQRAATDPWVDWLRALSTNVEHPTRLEDAEAFAFALEVVESGFARDTHGVVWLFPGSAAASWRRLLVRVRGALLRGERGLQDTLLVQLEARLRSMNPGFAQGAGAFRALADAYAGADLGPVEGPSSVTLVTLPAWLAGAEATAIGGTQADALRWLSHLDGALPGDAVTSLEWPVRRERVRALLALRADDASTAADSFERAIEGAETDGNAVEAALARLQLGQAVALRAVSRPRRAGALFSAGRDRLASLGIDASIHAYAVTRAMVGRPDDAGVAGLTPRELDVLTLLAQGLTYRDAGDRLGVSWRTVQSHARRVYAKLDVPGRAAALEAARARRIL